LRVIDRHVMAIGVAEIRLRRAESASMASCMDDRLPVRWA